MANPLLRQHRRLMKAGVAELRQRHGDAVGEILREAEQEFERLIPAIPYVGGPGNLSDTLEQMASVLALYRVLQRQGWEVDEFGELIQTMAKRQMEQIPRVIRWLAGRLYMTRWYRERLRRRAEESQKRLYPGHFVYEVVEGDGGTWGVDYHECGIVKFMQAQGAPELAPYMCPLDFLIFPAMGVQLERTGTIARGAHRCDFRFKGLL